MAFTVPGGQNTFIPTTELSGNLVVAFSRNVSKFPVNKIAQHRTVSKTTGFYTYFNPLDVARFSAGAVTSGGATLQTPQFDWPPGSPAPTGFTNVPGFEYRQFATRRKAYPGNLDLLGEQQASWPVLKTTSGHLAQLAMTDRALEVSGVISNPATYPSTHVDTAVNFGGDALDLGTPDNPVLKRAIQTLANIILKDTAGNVLWDNLTLVMNPNTASRLSRSQEIHAIMKESRYALPLIKGDKSIQSNQRFGLPDMLYGLNVVVEWTTYNPFNRGASGEAHGFVFPDDVIAVVSREEDFEAAEEANSYSTVHLFVYGPDDMKVESETDTWNRVIKLKVTDNRQALAVAGVSGGLITDIFTPA
jgi:hypothetical protein